MFRKEPRVSSVHPFPVPAFHYLLTKISIRASQLEKGYVTFSSRLPLCNSFHQTWNRSFSPVLRKVHQEESGSRKSLRVPLDVKTLRPENGFRWTPFSFRWSRRSARGNRPWKRAGCRRTRERRCGSSVNESNRKTDPGFRS